MGGGRASPHCAWAAQCGAARARRAVIGRVRVCVRHWCAQRKNNEENQVETQRQLSVLRELLAKVGARALPPRALRP